MAEETPSLVFEEEDDGETAGLSGALAALSVGGLPDGASPASAPSLTEVPGAGLEDAGDAGDVGDAEDAEDAGEGSQEHDLEFACRYCRTSDPACLVRCMESNSWFCNGSGSTSASHIIHHLVRSKNKEVCLHPESPLGQTVVECYNCSTKNIFTMGFIVAKGESMVVLLCRSCVQIGALKDLGWDMDSWTALIKDRQIVSWLVKVPENKEVERITTAQINRLEEKLKKDPGAGLSDLDDSDTEDDVNRVELCYEDGYHFQRVFRPLVQLEADYDLEMKGQMREDNLSIRWKLREDSNTITAVVKFTAAMSDSMRVAMGDELKLTLSKHLVGELGSQITKELVIPLTKEEMNKKNKRNPVARKDWECTGTVVAIDDDEGLHIELRSRNQVPTHVEAGYSLAFVWKPITFDRMQNALTTFAADDKSLSGYLFHKLLGHEVGEQILDVTIPQRLGVKGLPDLNESQTEAVRQVLRMPLALIQGPPGTGKTVTSASLVYHMVKQNKGEQVLVTAPSNVAVDQLTEKIHKTGLKVVRLAAKSREHLESSVEHLTLHNIIQSLGGSTSAELSKLLEKKEKANNHLSTSDARKLNKLRKNLEIAVLKAADVICCTCSGAGDPRISGMRFKRVLLDEATQATEPESLIPIVRGCKQFVLVGDHCQLGPVVMCKKAARAGLNSSMFERLVTLGLRPIRLAVQYRMHPCLSEFPSNTFYEGSLQNGVSEAQRVLDSVTFPWPNQSKPMMFFSCTGAEELASTGTSFLNRTEASNCERVVTALIRGGALPEQIGVVTPYEGQRHYIVQHMQRNGQLKMSQYKEVEVSSVDAFQGREKDFIILSCVRSNERQGIGFLNDPRRLNVALTRAKYGCIVLGNPRVLAKQPLWNGLLNHFRNLGLLVEGSLNNLQVSQMRFPKSKKFYRDHRQRAFDENAEKAFSGDLSDPYGTGSPKYEEPVQDSRHDPRYGGECHPMPAAAVAKLLEGPSVPMPEIPGVPPLGAFQFPELNTQQSQDMEEHIQLPVGALQEELPRYRGYGNFDYTDSRQMMQGSVPDRSNVMNASQMQHQPSTQAHQHLMTQASQASQSQLHHHNMLTQAPGLATQSQSQYLFMPSLGTQSTQSQSGYHFEDEE